MTTGNRGNTRSQGRTPSFILIGLLLVIGYLGYSYWSLSNSYSDLTAVVESLQLQKKDADDRNSEREKDLENTREELRSTQGNLDQSRKNVQDKEAEILILKTDISSKQSDVEKFKNHLSECDTSLTEHKSSLNTLKFENEELNKRYLEAKSKEPSCTFETCTIHIRSVIAIVAKLIGSGRLGKALSEANFDAYKLMEGIQSPEELVDTQQLQNQQLQVQNQQQKVQNQPQQGQNQPQQGQNQPLQGQNQPQQDQNQQVVDPNLQGVNQNQQGNESQVKGISDVANSSIVNDVTVAENNVTQPIEANKDNSSLLDDQSERNKNIVEIDMFEKVEQERQHDNEDQDNPDAILKNDDVENEKEKGKKSSRKKTHREAIKKRRI